MWQQKKNFKIVFLFGWVIPSIFVCLLLFNSVVFFVLWRMLQFKNQVTFFISFQRGCCLILVTIWNPCFFFQFLLVWWYGMELFSSHRFNKSKINARFSGLCFFKESEINLIIQLCFFVMFCFLATWCFCYFTWIR